MGHTEPLPRFACPDWWERIQAGETPMADVPLNEDRAAMALAFFNRLRLPDGEAAGQLLRDTCPQWFRDILMAFLASEDPETGARLVWECLCMVPKKSSKTTYTAALALTALYLEETPRAQMLLIAPSQNISTRSFNQAQAMIRMDPLLAKVFHIQDHKLRITRKETGAQLTVKTFDTGIVTGEIPVLTIIDELHELGRKKSGTAVMQQIRGGGITKRGGQVMMITTQSDHEPAGIWASELKKARAIRAGQGGANPRLLPVLYEFPQELQKDESFWRDRDNWHFVLPSLGYSIDREKLEADYENNGTSSPEAEQIWMSQHLNIEIGIGLHSERWIGAEYWASRTVEGLDLDGLLARSEVVVAGGDLGGADDLASLHLLGRCAETRRWLSWTRAWCVPDVLDRRQEIAPKLRDLEAVGELVIDESPTRHVRDIADLCDKVRDAGLFPESAAIGLDPWGVAALMDEFVERGYPAELIYGVAQGYKINGAIKGLERRLLDGTIEHGGQKIMTWVIGNAKAEARGNNVLITKARAGVGKIDPLIAMFNAAMLMDMNPEPARAAALRIPDDYMVA